MGFIGRARSVGIAVCDQVLGLRREKCKYAVQKNCMMK